MGTNRIMQDFQKYFKHLWIFRCLYHSIISSKSNPIRSNRNEIFIESIKSAQDVDVLPKCIFQENKVGGGGRGGGGEGDDEVVKVGKAINGPDLCRFRQIFWTVIVVAWQVYPIQIFDLLKPGPGPLTALIWK